MWICLQHSFFPTDMILYLLAATTTITTLFMQVQGQCEFKAKQDDNVFILFMRIKMSYT